MLLPDDHTSNILKVARWCPIPILTVCLAITLAIGLATRRLSCTLDSHTSTEESLYCHTKLLLHL
jgi:hypothetical protein